MTDAPESLPILTVDDQWRTDPLRLAVAGYPNRWTASARPTFTVTVFATVGFGHIHPGSGLARIAVTGQMVSDVVLIGVVVRVLVAAARTTLSGGATPEQPDTVDGN